MYKKTSLAGIINIAYFSVMLLFMLAWQTIVMLNHIDNYRSFGFISKFMSSYYIQFAESSWLTVIGGYLVSIAFFGGLLLASIKHIKREHATLEQYFEKRDGSIAYATFAYGWAGLVLLWPFSQRFHILLLVIAIVVAAPLFVSGHFLVQDIKKSGEDFMAVKRAEKEARIAAQAASDEA